MVGRAIAAEVKAELKKIPDFVHLETAARALDINYETLKKQAQKGKFPAFKVGNLWRVRVDALDEYTRPKNVVSIGAQS